MSSWSREWQNDMDAMRNRLQRMERREGLMLDLLEDAERTEKEQRELISVYRAAAARGYELETRVTDLRERIDRQADHIAKLRDALFIYDQALAKVATPRRPDGTYNHSREACEEIARTALGASDARRGAPVPPVSQTNVSSVSPVVEPETDTK